MTKFENPSKLIDRGHVRPPVTVTLHNGYVAVGWLTAFTNTPTHHVRMDCPDGRTDGFPRYAVKEIR